jgi:DEAD/DEAH box helicase domain-containing protein
MVDANELSEIARRTGFTVSDRTILPSKLGTFSAVPAALHLRVKTQCTIDYPNGLYGHQSRAIEAGLNGQDICLATSTASGKSLVFIALAAHLLLSDPGARVIAMYPARALILDQLKKWDAAMKPLGIRTGRIDGGIPVNQRAGILKASRVVLMTPDVAQAWLMRSLAEKAVALLMSSLRLLVLDEAHTYEGVFGTNMAYFLRRFEFAAGKHQIVLSTATLKDAEQFSRKLTGRNFRCFEQGDETQAVAEKTVMTLKLQGDPKKSFESISELLASLSQIAMRNQFRFLAFGDSRKLVEQVVVTTQRALAKLAGKASDEPDELDTNMPESMDTEAILPYRAGYEEEDRRAIQKALGDGQLAGVVATSALELGIDIGEIDVVVFLGTPPSMKSFWQRLGRAGRKNSGVCLLIDDEDLVASLGGLPSYIMRPLEPNWLYLDNRYIQYSHVLCAAGELDAQPQNPARLAIFDTLPPTFRRYLDNEIEPREPVPNDLYELKQKAQAGPHQEFPMRSAIEPNFKVSGPFGKTLGNLSYSYALREAYPGAIYYYMARPYRVIQFNFRDGDILVRKEKKWTTSPIRRVMVFPKFPDGILSYLASGDTWLIESEVQVSEQVLGFNEQRGPNKEPPHTYDLNSPYSQRALNRFFRTTGVCIQFAQLGLQQQTVETLVEAFCAEFGVQDRDIGIGDFFSRVDPQGAPAALRGFCVYDATNGSLRLTEQLAQNFGKALTVACELAQRRSETFVLNQLRSLMSIADSLASVRQEESSGDFLKDGWMEVISPGEKGIYHGEGGRRDEVEIVNFRYTPKGAVYDAKTADPKIKQSYGVRSVEPIFGITKTCWWNPDTGEIRDKD